MRAAATLALAILLAGCGARETREPPRPPLPNEWGEDEPSRAWAGYRDAWERCRRARSPGVRICERGASTIDICRPHELPDYDPCGAVLLWSRVTIELRQGDDWRVVAGHPPGDLWKNTVIGHWRAAWLSPHRSMVLAQWSGECETPVAFFVDVRARAMRPVTGERDWRNAIMSVAHGWSDDGRAHVSLLEPGCGEAHPDPGRYLIDPRTHTLERVGSLAPPYSR